MGRNAHTDARASLSGKHADNLRPKMNSGVVVKFNANQRYATTSATAALLRVLAAKANVPLQEFATRNDMPCGSTIGPIVASGLGVRTIGALASACRSRAKRIAHAIAASASRCRLRDAEHALDPRDGRHGRRPHVDQPFQGLLRPLYRRRRDAHHRRVKGSFSRPAGTRTIALSFRRSACAAIKCAAIKYVSFGI